jgi:RNA recognition motif-containing protein
MSDKQNAKVFIGGLSWETTGEKLRAYFENFGSVREAFVSYNRNNGRPRGFGFVVFESSEVADKVVATKHMIDRREVRAVTSQRSNLQARRLTSR